MRKKLLVAGIGSVGGIVLCLVLVYATLPLILEGMGYHPDYDRVEYNLEGRHALIITTTHVVTHVLPPVPELLINPFLRDARAVFNDEVRMANDGTMVKLPVNSDDIVITELLR